LESLGVKFLRFNDIDVKKDITYVLRAIDNYIVRHEEENGIRKDKS